MKRGPAQFDGAWYVYVNDAVEGPYDLKQFRDLFGNRFVNPDTLVTREGTENWTEAASDPALAIVFVAPKHEESNFVREVARTTFWSIGLLIGVIAVIGSLGWFLVTPDTESRQPASPKIATAATSGVSGSSSQPPATKLAAESSEQGITKVERALVYCLMAHGDDVGLSYFDEGKSALAMLEGKCIDEWREYARECTGGGQPIGNCAAAGLALAQTALRTRGQ
jgi:hypothetical protein